MITIAFLCYTRQNLLRIHKVPVLCPWFSPISFSAILKAVTPSVYILQIYAFQPVQHFDVNKCRLYATLIWIFICILSFQSKSLLNCYGALEGEHNSGRRTVIFKYVPGQLPRLSVCCLFVIDTIQTTCFSVSLHRKIFRYMSLSGQHVI